MSFETRPLNAKIRTGAGKGFARRTRAEGLVPGVVYGPRLEKPLNIAVNAKETKAAIQTPKKMNTVLGLNVDGKQIGEASFEVPGDLPPGYQVKLIGQAEEFGKTTQYMIFAFALALALLYMVLASQFDSFLQPFNVMLAQPLAIIGGVAALWATGQTLNIDGGQVMHA